MSTIRNTTSALDDRASRAIHASLRVITLVLALAVTTAITHARAVEELLIGANAAPDFVSVSRLMACGFEKNVGQYGDEIEYVLRMPAGALLLTKRGAILQRIARAEPFPEEHVVDGTNVWLDIGDSDVASREMRGENKLATKFHYFLGPDPSAWCVDVPLYSEILVSGVAPGIIVRWSVRDGVPSFDFEAEPGTDLSSIPLSIDGAESLEFSESGAIEITTAQGDILHGQPVSYRIDAHGARCEGRSHVERLGNRTWYYRVEDSGTDHRTVLDPTLEFSTFLGGTDIGHDWPTALGVDPWGRAVVAGQPNWQAGFPTTPGAFQESAPSSNGSNSFVTKFDSNGSALEFSTFFGPNASTGSVNCGDLTVLGDGSIVICGVVGGNTTGFPITAGAFQTTKDLFTSGFVTKFNPDGSGLVFSTYLGGSDFDLFSDLDAMPDESIMLLADVKSNDIPLTPGAYNTVPSEDHRGYVARLSAAGSNLLYATQITSASGELVFGLAANEHGVVVVGSHGNPIGLPITQGAYDVTMDGISDAYIVKFDPTLSTLLFCTWFGGSQTDRAYDCDLDKAGNTYVVGETASFNLPQIPGGLTNPYGDEAFVAKFDPTGSTLLYSGYYGGSGSSQFGRIAVSSKRRAWITAAVNSPNLPLTPDAIAGAYPSGTAVAVINTQGSAFDFSTYLSGPEFNTLEVSYVALDGSDNGYVAGRVWNATFPTTPNAYDTILAGPSDVHLSKFRTCPGSFERYGQGCPGTPWSGYGAEPLLSGLGCPKGGEIITLSIRRAWGGTPALLLFGFGESALPLNGACSLSIAPIAPSLVLPLWIPGTGTGTGQLDLTGTLPATLPAGVVRTQVLVADPGGFAGIAATAPLRITFAP